jgi:TonB family protein
MPRLERFIFYSFLIHAAFIAGLIIKQFSLNNTKNYYSVDLYGGGPAPSAEANLNAEPEAPKETVAPEPVKEKVVNPKEDLLIKSKKKDKKIKEVISQVPAIPIPKAPGSRKEKGDSGGYVPSAVPGASDGSGVGVGFGADGWKGSGGAGNFPYQWYIQSVKKKLDQNWNVSSGYSRRIYAQTAFTIQKNGSVSDVEIEESSGNSVFDSEARRAVQLSAPFPPLPRGFEEPTLRVHVRFTVKF